MSTEIVIAMYRPHEGKERELRALIDQHLPTLREHELATDRAAMLLEAEDGTYLEIFEWSTPDAASRAHTHPAVVPIWEAMGQVADFVTLSSLAEASKPFPHFTPVA